MSVYPGTVFAPSRVRLSWCLGESCKSTYNTLYITVVQQCGYKPHVLLGCIALCV